MRKHPTRQAIAHLYAALYENIDFLADVECGEVNVTSHTIAFVRSDRDALIRELEAYRAGGDEWKS